MDESVGICNVDGCALLDAFGEEFVVISLDRVGELGTGEDIDIDEPMPILVFLEVLCEVEEMRLMEVNEVA